MEVNICPRLFLQQISSIMDWRLQSKFPHFLLLLYRYLYLFLCSSGFSNSQYTFFFCCCFPLFQPVRCSVSRLGACALIQIRNNNNKQQQQPPPQPYESKKRTTKLATKKDIIDDNYYNNKMLRIPNTTKMPEERIFSLEKGSCKMFQLHYT